ncbi:hypothetical protein [Streptomyces sp. NPDC051554]|uniref:hypothetical protein n=1 Tax=Streptomyces sp. NPDC051554 TaxID=3365656 RepID=UPI003798E71C
MSPHSGSPFARRDFIKLAGAGAVGAATLTAPATVPTAAAATAAARTHGANAPAQVTLFVESQPSTFAADGTGKISVTVGNLGPDDATGAALVRIVSPFYANFDHGAEPSGFSRYLVENPAPNIPELMECRIPPLAAGAHTAFDVHLKMVDHGPAFPGAVRIGVTPETDTVATDVRSRIGVELANPDTELLSPPAGANTVNLYFTYAKPVLSSARTRSLHVLFGNVGPHSPASDAVFTFVSPFASKVDRTDAAFRRLNPTYLHDETDVWVPDIVTVPVSKTLLAADLALLTDLLHLSRVTIPLSYHGGASGDLTGRGYLAAQGDDFDLDKSVAMSTIKVMCP